MSSSVVRNLGAPTPSLREEAECRRHRVKLAGWSLIGVVSFLAAGKVLAVIVGDALALFMGMPPALWPKGGQTAGPQEQSRGLPSTASDKLLTIARDAAAGLDLWRSGLAVVGQEDVSVEAARLLREFEDTQKAVRELQGSLGKARSVGSVAGVVSWDLEKSHALLKEEQTALAKRSGDIHALARRIIEENDAHKTVDAADASPTSGEALREKLSQGLVDTDINALRRPIREAERAIEAAISVEEAELLVARFADAAGAAIGAKAGQGRGRTSEVSDEQIIRIVKEEVLSADMFIPPEGCISVSLARNLTKARLERYGADQTGIPDYAMGPAGARVITSLTSDTYEPTMGFMQKMQRKRRKESHQTASSPPMAINPESRLGRCWPMKGSQGELTVKLSRTINVERVSIEHASRVLLLNKGESAPKDFSVIGYAEGWVPGGNDAGDVLVSGAEYLLEGDVIQFFDVAEEFRGREYATVTLQVESNHGEGEFTCIYRFRVHGTPTQ